MRGYKLSFDKTTILLVVALLFILVSKLYSESLTPDDIIFTISLDKEEYFVNEPIWLSIIVENLNEEMHYVTSVDPHLGFMHFYVVSTSGDTLEGGCIQAVYFGTPVLDPRQQDIQIINLLGPPCSFGIENEDVIFSKLIPRGEYTVQVKLKGSIRLNGKRETFTILSDQLQFKVRPPHGDEKEVYDLLLRGYRKLRKSLKESKRLDGMEDFRRVIDEYPHSAYVDVAYDKLAHMFENVNNVRKFIERYPNSGHVWHLLRLNAPKEKDKRKEFFEDVIGKYPNTKASACAEILLDKWKRGKLWSDEKIE
ncbi:MAG: hypothetical protein WBD28_11720 [Candidatus Zixiibacteriota bacterium]